MIIKIILSVLAVISWMSIGIAYHQYKEKKEVEKNFDILCDEYKKLETKYWNTMWFDCIKALEKSKKTSKE